MLVLSRQRSETIMIGDDIEITVVDIRGDKVRLGITAPVSVAVHRREVYDEIQKEQGLLPSEHVSNELGIRHTVPVARNTVPPRAHAACRRIAS